ncbi:Ig-like domain-containing protein [Erysipelothrix piscisicarius]|uniref:Ig-like domain-containing protein n=1 Tax=Erysipelothrix piscisicarius TaxID=2485784 RepID=UPI002F93FEEF
MKGSYKTDFSIVANGKPTSVNLTIDQYNQNTIIKPSIEFELPEASTWTDFEHEFKIESATDFLPVFKFSFIKGSYSIKNISLQEKEIASDIKLTSLDVVQDAMTLAPQDQASIKPIVEPSDYPVDRLEWSSSDLGIATVDAQGIVTAVSEGNSVITVFDSKSGLSKTIHVSVRAPKDTNLFAVNILENGSFEKLVKAPNKGNTSQINWHQDVGFWDQDLKPESWVFERYKSSNLDASYYSAEMVKSDVKDGSYAVKINLERNDQSALSFFKPQKRYDVKPETTYVYEGWFKSENLETLNAPQARINLQVDGYAANKLSGVVHADTINASDQWVRFKVEFTTDDKTTQILPVFRMHNTKGSYFLDDLMLYEKPIGATSIQLDTNALEMALNQKIFLPVSTEPKTINQKTLEWSSSDPSVVTVDQGSIVGLKPGIAKVQVRSAFDPSVYDEVTVTVLNSTSLPIQSLSVASDNLKIDENQRYFIEFELTPRHANYRDLTFISKDQKIVNVTEEIVSGMEHLYKVFNYNGNQSVFEGNWWDYQVLVVRKAITDSLILLADYLPHQRLEALEAVVASYVPNAVDQMSKKGDIATGANRTDLAMSLLGTALLSEDVSKLERLQNDLVPLFELATSEDGIYEDGSMVQHKTIPYTGGYGSVYLEGVSSLFNAITTKSMAFG